MFTRWWTLLSTAAVLLGQPAPQPASVSGTVTNSITGEPVLRAHVMARCMPEGRQQQQQQTYGSLTNPKGEFSLSPIPPGDCSMDVQRVGFVAPVRPEHFVLSSGAHKESVKLTLIPAGAITGHVLNSAGEPTQGIDVHAEGSSGSISATTDERGQFRIGGLRPGKYRLKAGKQSLPFPPELRADGTLETRDATTYYPDSLSAKTAQRLEVKAGAEVSGVEIKLVQVPIVKVSGKVTGLSPGTKNVMMNLQPSAMGAAVKADGTFVIWRLDPGKYSLRAQQWNGSGQMHSAPLEIEVTTANLENLELRMIPPFEIAGQLRFDDDQARQPLSPPTRSDGSSAPPPPPQERRVVLRPAFQQGGQQFFTPLNADDSFTQQNVQPDRYRVSVSGVSGYVKSLRAGDTETDGDVLDLRNGSPGTITLTISSNYCEISGTVSDSKGPAAEVAVALLAADEPVSTEYGQSNSAGRYQFRVPPGKYRLLVMEEGGGFWNMQPGALDDVEGEFIEVKAGDKVPKDLARK